MKRVLNFFILIPVLTLVKAQPTAVVTPSSYNASLHPESSFIFKCDVTGADGIRWAVDGLLSTRPEIRNRGIIENELIVVNATTGSFRRSISIERNITNKNTSIICHAESIFSAGVSSGPVLFKIQGLLDAPSNLMLSEADNQHMRRLSWDEPFSLDITNIEPDISHYKVCYSLVDAIKSQCVLVNQTEFIFPYVNVPLHFIVSAVNVVGEGSVNSTFHDGNGCNNTTDLPIINTSQIQIRVLSGSNPIARFLFDQQLLRGINGITCFSIYEIESSPLTAANTANHGIQIPGVVQYSQSSIQLSLTVDSDLVDNEQYSATIITINADGERGHNVTVEFDTYDVQSVSGTAIAGGLELSCTFAEGSQAQSCILTIYRTMPLENGMEMFAMNITISRENPQTSGRVSNLELGEYVVREVAEVESDGQVTTHRRRDVLKLVITQPSPAATSESTMLTPDLPSTGGVSGSPTQIIGPIVGGTVLAVLLFAGIIVTVTVFVIVAYRRYKLHHGNQETPQAVYEEPYDWAASRLQQTEPVMEQCPAYGVLTK